MCIRIKVLFSEEAESIYQDFFRKANISKKERMILKAVDQKVEFIKMDSHYGNPIAKQLIPSEYIMKYDVKNLFRVELPCFWRMIYTLKESEKEEEIDIIIVALVIDIIDYKTYNKKFGYKDR